MAQIHVVLLAAGMMVLAAASSKQCTGDDMQGSLFLQADVRQRVIHQDFQEPDMMNMTRSRADDARFLMMASFGPTRDTLDSLSQKNFAQWIQEQMHMPVELHREYYRSRANPGFDTETQASGRWTSRSPCSKGSRWQRYALNQMDQYKRIDVTEGKVMIDGGFRTDIQVGALASRWAGLGNYTGKVCYVEEAIGGDVHLTTGSSCSSSKITMPNPAIHVADSSGVVKTPLPFHRLKPGTLVLGTSALPCNLTEEMQQIQQGDSFIIEADGDYYAHDSRVELLENRMANPSEEVCPPLTFLNEKSCLVQALASKGPVVQGLLAEVHHMKRKEYTSFVSEAPSSRPVTAFVHQAIDYAGGSLSHPALPDSYFSVQFKGSLSVQQAGSYEFYIDSDDGSQLLINGVKVVSNGGFHGMQERSGIATLAAGNHSIMLEYFQGSSESGLIFRWKGPDSGNEKAVVPGSAFFSETPSWSTRCFLPCGSPGENANDPSQGHQFNLMTTRDHSNKDFDNRFHDRMSNKLSKAAVWMAKALAAQDQLRQRMAWALSQIFVVSSQGFSNDDANSRSEMWLNYYDIFVRHAFGNFRDILKEVTYSPLMGQYLTHTGSSSYDDDDKFPNENYAREVMQLFTIGIEKLHTNGSIQKDAQGEDVSTYDTEDIMNFARVFTGFKEQSRRGNIEDTSRRRSANLIDPLYIQWFKHDVHPKPDLDGGFLGDGYPVCDESRPELFLSQGSKYKFLTYYYTGGSVLELNQSSALYQLLCAEGDNGCTFPAAVTLEQSLQCTGNECGAVGVTVVKVHDMYYSHSPPACVHHYLQAWKGSNSSIFYMKGAKGTSCTDGSEIDDPRQAVFTVHEEQHCGGRSINVSDHIYGNSSYVDVEECKAICMSVAECAGFVRRSKDGRCSYWKRGSLSRYARAGHQCYEKVHPGCDEGVRASFGSHSGKPWYGSSTWKPRGCSFYNNRMYFNIHPTGYASSSYEPVCKAHIVVHEGAKVSASGVEPVSFSVPWEGTRPSAGLTFISVEEMAVFDRMPTRQEVQTELKIGAYKPSGACSSGCAGEVKAYSLDGSTEITGSTVFEVDGRYFSNTKSLIRTADGHHVFRSPPAFMRGQSGESAENAAMAEVDCLLNHLFHHTNTPVFVSRRLIQRFGNSNPSAAYIEAVANAFRTGKYADMTFSGEYGDLAASVTAILLHEDARMEGALGLQGSLREPLLKIVHLMRSMEYKDIDNIHVVFDELQDLIGQFPFQAPTVFNYYLANFGFPMPEMTTDGMMMESGPEPEPEPEPLVAPELQILTPPHFMGFLNGVSSLLKSGVSYKCDAGHGMGIRANHYDGLTFRETCPQGKLAWEEFGDENQTLEELNVLLTAGRLTPVAKEAARAAYTEAAPQERLQRAQQAILLTPEFHTLGAPMPRMEPRPAKLAPPSLQQHPYKATVILFLAGGADTWNMLVPGESCALRQEYEKVRTDLAMSPSDLIDIQVADQPCDTFGIHGQFSVLKQLYDSKEALFVTNVGSLVEPTSKEQYKSKEAQRCVGLFSHSDQQTAAQTLQCQTMGNSPRGVGGRIADALAAAAESYRVASFSLAGSAIFAQGLETNRQIVDGEGNRRFHEYEMWRETIANITKQQHEHIFSEQYAKTFLESVETTESLGRAFEHVQLATDYRSDSSLEKQLEQVAKLIQVREVRQAERDFFFVQVGGWDMHSNMKPGLAAKFADINRALEGFIAELRQQGIWDSVVLATTSEFARTLDSNGGGSDHAWGGQHFMVGGSVKGGSVLNKFPSSLKENGYNDLGRGRLIPEYPFETMMLPIAEWMGLDTSNQEVLSSVFPNLKNFNSTIVKSADHVFDMA
eukprot:TRINITY_DN1167_c0_g1_i6.p1 TRINITY_DN1167_c0_g1~~TRINITY_DN1167_c0_g1_i6.p1  ORF type:complete len:1841 (-),score=350.18 TRINITY_DN1167_c0_g1_i6:148-5670(-)